MSEYKEVTKEFFNEYLDNYEGKLKSGVSSICEPPIRHYLDESKANDSEVGSADRFFSMVVAKIEMDWAKFENGKMVATSNSDDFWRYYIKLD